MFSLLFEAFSFVFFFEQTFYLPFSQGKIYFKEKNGFRIFFANNQSIFLVSLSKPSFLHISSHFSTKIQFPSNVVEKHGCKRIENPGEDVLP